MSHSPKNRSVIYNWIISYILIILIPIIVTCFVYLVSKNVIEDEISNSNNMVIRNIRDTMDNIIDDVERLTIEAASNMNILNVLNITKRDDHSPYYTIYTASKELTNYRLFNGDKNRLYIYFDNIKKVITPNCSYDDKEFFDLYLKTDQYSYDMWKNTMTSNHMGDYMLMPYHEESMGEVSMVAVLRSFPISLHGDNSANIVVLLNFNDLFYIYDKYGQVETRNIQIIDNKGNVMAGKNNGIELSVDDYGKMVNDYGKMEKTLKDGKKIIISYTSSNVNDWKYIIAMPQSVFWHKAQYIRNIMFGSIAVCIFLGGVMAYFFLKKSYNPLKEVVTYFKANTSTQQANNEYGYIRDAFKETLAQKEKITRRLEQQKKVIKSNYLANLLKGKKSLVPVDEFLSTYDITFKYNRFTVMVIYIENMDDEFWMETADGSEDVYALSMLVIKNVVEELLNRKTCAYVTEIDDMLACLINIDADIDFKAEILSVIMEADGFLEKNYCIRTNYSVGQLHESLDGISASYSEAISTMEYSQVMGTNNTVFYSDIGNESGNSYYYPVEKEYQLINCIKGSDLKEASAILDDIINKNMVHHTPTLELVRCLKFDLISTILKAVNDVDKPDDKKYFDSMNPAGELMKCKTIPELKERMHQILEDSCNYFFKTGSQVNYKIRDMVIEIVQNNYSDQNLGISSIAESVGKNSHYISRVFKEQTGQSIVDYINKIRIQKAKELLQENKWNQEEISGKVGYTNVRTFQRCFKKIEGISPGRVKA